MQRIGSLAAHVLRARWIATVIAGTLALTGCKDGAETRGGSGFIEADEVLVSAEIGGRIVHLRVAEGATVAAGDTLAVIDTTRIDLEIAAAVAIRQTTVDNLEAARLAVVKSREAQDYAQQERDRVSRLLQDGSGTKRQLDQLEFELTQAKTNRRIAEANVAVIASQITKIDADLDRLRRSRQDCFPMAPSAGLVLEKLAEHGELVSPGKGLLKLADLDTVTVKVYLPTGLLAEIKVGDQATVSTETGDADYTGVVSWTSPSAEFTPKNVQTEKSRANLVYAVKVTVPNSDGRLKIGMPVFVTFR